MRVGLAVSVVSHLLLLVWGLVTLRSADPLEAGIEALPIELVEIAEVSDINKGRKDAEAKPEPSPNDPTETALDVPEPAPKPAPKPKPEPPPPTPPPPPPPAAETPPVDPTETAATPPPPAAAEPAPAPEPDPLKELASVEPQPAPAEEPKPTPAAEEPKTTSTPPPLPRPRPDRPAPKPTVPATTPETKENFDADRIAALLDKSKPEAAAAPSDAPASLGVASGGDAPALTLNELDALRAQIQQCWVIPIGWTDPRQVSVVIRFALNQDGTVNGSPSVIEFPASQYGQVAADNAIRAILRCGPYQLPPEKYDQWSEVQIRFEPQG